MVLKRDRGRYYEDADVGDTYMSPPRTVTEADLAAFAALSGDYGPMYVDEEYARSTALGGRMIPNLLGLGLVEGLVSRVPPGEGRGIASLGWRWRFHRAVRPGDTVSVSWRIARKRRSRRHPDRGIVEEALTLGNHRGDVLQSGVHSLLLACRTPLRAATTEFAEPGDPCGLDPDALWSQVGHALMPAPGSASPRQSTDDGGVFLEDITPGCSFTSPSRTVTEPDIVRFAGVTGDYAMIHTDEEYCRRTEFGTRVAHGLLGLSVAEGLKRRVMAYAGAGTTLAPLAVNWSFRKPIFPGDTVHVRWSIVQNRPGTGGRLGGTLVEEVRLVNQRGEAVQEGQQLQMMRSRASLAIVGHRPTVWPRRVDEDARGSSGSPSSGDR